MRKEERQKLLELLAKLRKNNDEMKQIIKRLK